jgi:hypothetical protein
LVGQSQAHHWNHFTNASGEMFAGYGARWAAGALKWVQLKMNSSLSPQGVAA